MCPFPNAQGACGCGARKIAELERQNAQLQEVRLKQLEEQIETLSLAAKRQAASFSRGLPKVDPKRPGQRKSGEDYGTKAFRTVPPKIDEVYAASLPEKCPHCGGAAFRGVYVKEQYQVEIPRRPIYRRFNVAIGQCSGCGQRVQGRHPLQTSDALGCCASQVGPEAQAAVVMLNKELGLSQGKISRFFQTFFGIKLTRGGSCQIMLRAAERCQGNYQAIVKRVRESPFIVPDETGWRIGGNLAWLHVAVGQDAVAYVIGTRGIATSILLIGKAYAGKLTHDGWASYDQFLPMLHQTCLTHLWRALPRDSGNGQARGGAFSASGEGVVAGVAGNSPPPRRTGHHAGRGPGQARCLGCADGQVAPLPQDQRNQRTLR